MPVTLTFPPIGPRLNYPYSLREMRSEFERMGHGIATFRERGMDMGEVQFIPKYASWLNPWWKKLRSLALKGRWFETRDELTASLQ